MSHLWHWPQKPHNFFQAYLTVFSRSLSSFFNLQIWRAKFNSIWPRQISCQTRAYQFILSLWHTFWMLVLCYTVFPVLYSLSWLSLYTCTNCHYWWSTQSFHISIILYSICMFQTKCHHIQFSFHNNYYKIFKCPFLRSSYNLCVFSLIHHIYTDIITLVLI